MKKVYEEEITANLGKARNLILLGVRADADIARLNEAVCEEIDNRDHWEGRATNLAEAVGEHLGVDVGEHSSMNCPVRNAFIALNEASALDTAAETNIKRLSYVMHNHQLAMVVATTLLESGRAAEAATWLRNTLTCYEGKWPHPNEDMDQWVAQQMEGVHWPSNPSTSEAVSHDEDSKFYSVGETDILTATSVTEAVQEYIDQCELDGIQPSEEVEVYGYNHMAISEDCASFDYCIEHLIECLDENYGNPEEPSQYELSDEAKALFLAFKKQVVSEYEVWGCELNGDPFIVKVADYES